MDHIELWDKAKALMREELANVSYTTWIEQPLKPVYVVDDKLALEVISDFNEKTIRARYLPMITEAVSQAAGASSFFWRSCHSMRSLTLISSMVISRPAAWLTASVIIGR